MTFLSPKKIGIDARFFSEKATGVGRHVFELIQELAKLDTKNKYVVFLNLDNFENFALPGKNFRKEWTDAKHYSFAEQWNFLKQINKHDFDLMVFPQFNAPIFYNKPFVVTIHDLTLHLFPGKKKTDIISRLAYKLVINLVTRRAKHCFAVSENTKKDMLKFLGLSPDKITVAHNGVTQRFKPLEDNFDAEEFRKKHKLPKKYFLYTGVLRSHKNIAGLIRAYYRFLKRCGKAGVINNEDTDADVDSGQARMTCSRNDTPMPHLVITGPYDPTYSEIPELIEELNLKDKVHMLGLFPEDDFASLMGLSSGYVFPSFYEGFGIPPLEAMQCGVPVACSNTSSLPEVCSDAAIYFDPYNVDEIAKALEVLAFDEEKRKELVMKGFEQCKKFRWEDMGRKMFGVYERVIRY